VIRRLILTALLFPFIAAAADKPPPKLDHFQRAGLWETKTILARDGEKMDPIVKHKCIAPNDVDREEQSLFQPFKNGCAGQRKFEGKTVSWTYSCVGPPPMKGSGTLTYDKDAYSGTSESFADLKGNQLRMTRTQVDFTAHRIGDCTKTTAKPDAGTVPVPKKPAPIPKPDGKIFKKPVNSNPDVTASSGSTAIR